MKRLAFFLLLLPIYAFGQAWFSTYQAADLMVSGLGFNQTGGALQFNHPNGLASDGTNLLMCDRFNNRVLVWNTAPTAWNTPPDLVLGQADFDSNNAGLGKNEMNWPGNVSVATNGKVAVADTDNDRLLLWNNFPNANGQAADVSIHLPTISPVGVPLRWGWPWGIWTDGTRLAAVATMGGTLLFWNTFPTTDNQSPDYTISHSDFGTPRNISTDGSTFFFVGDHNAQVNGIPGTFFWNSYPSAANQAYDFYRDEWIKGTKMSNNKLIASGLSSIYTWNSMPTTSSQNPDATASPACYDNGDGVDVVEANGKIYVCNYNGNDVLVYSNPPDNQNPNPDFAIGVSDYNNNTLDSVGYIQNPSFSTDGTRLIITSDYDKRIYIYHNFPTISGQMADEVISTQSYNLAPWDNALYNNTFVAAGSQTICVWNNANNLSLNPSKIFNGNIGTAIFSDLKGVALDNQYLYVADKTGKVFIWAGIPADNTVNPLYTLDFGNVSLNRLSSDGTYFCITQQSPGAVYIYKVADLAQGNTTVWKTIDGIGFLNLPSETITFNGSLAIANQSFQDILLWQDINDAPDTNNMVVLGNASNSSNNIPAIGEKNLYMPGSLLYENNHLWVGEHKFSSRVLKFSTGNVATDNQLINNKLTIYPNPASDNLTIQSAEILDGKSLLLLFDNKGRLVFHQDVENFSNISIDLSSIQCGIYYIQMINEQNKRLTEKVIISK